MLLKCANFLLVSVFLFAITLLPACHGAQPTSRQNIKIYRLTNPLLHSEGPHWDEQKQILFFVDIEGETVYRYDPRTKKLTSAAIGEKVSVIIPIKNTKNEFLIGRGTGLTRLTWNGENTTSPGLDVLSVVDQDKPGNRFNDGKADATGRLWLGTMGKEQPIGNVTMNQGTLYKIPNNDSCQLKPMVRPVSISNGIAWSLDNRYMYYIDTPTRKIRQFDYQISTGGISNTKIAFDFAKANVSGNPDGMTIDKSGNLWIAAWGGSQIIHVNPKTGQLLYSIKMPVERPTSVMFGGPNLSILYVTSMRIGLTADELKTQPYAGSVYAIYNIPVGGYRNHPVNDCKES